MIDDFFLNSFISGKEDYTNDNNMIVGVVRSSITQISKSSSKKQIATRQVTNKLLKSVTSNMVTEIVVEVINHFLSDLFHRHLGGVRLVLGHAVIHYMTSHTSETYR